MKIDKERIDKYLDQIASEIEDLEQVLKIKDEDIVADPHLLKSLKYSIIIIAEAIASTLQHILAKKHNTVVDGYTAVYVQSQTHAIISSELLTSLSPFFKFRNMLVHQYWKVDNQVFVENIRDGLNDFEAFVKEINKVVKYN